MQALHKRTDKPPRRRWPWLLAAAVVLVLAAAGGAVYATRSGTGPGAAVSCSKGVSCTNGGSTSASDGPPPLTVSSLSPATGATGVASDTTVTVTFGGSVAAGTDPSISPAVNGTWQPVGADKLEFTPSAPFVPFTKYTVTVPGGAGGMRSSEGGQLRTTVTSTFTIASGSTTRLQQLLAQLNYLPLSYTAATVPPQEMAMPQPGTLAWRWSGLPSQLTSQWIAGTPNPITKGAIMAFETENGLSVDGIPGPQVWATLLADAATKKVNTETVTFVLVTKTLPEHVTVWVTGGLKFANILANTGVPGATTTDGTYQVFEHVKASDMKGCNVTGSCYTDPTVPWASYFNGGDALHGFTRANYGYPQSNGCVEMRPTTAGAMWPYTPIGTVVTVQGPPGT